VLTAGHIMGKRSIEVDGESRVVDVRFVTVSPARNGRNSGAGNPFGKVKSKAVMVDRGSDFALIILEKDLAGATHSRLKGALGFWGSNPAVAAIRQFEPAALQGKETIVSGYPGDTCGKDQLAKADKARKMSLCLYRRPDEWASTQWASAGILEPVAHTPLLYHTADTYNGQSGAPLCLAADHRLYLIGIHTGPHNAQKNKGVRVTNLMLKKLCEWMNADAGYPIASLQNDTLLVQAPSYARAGTQEYFDGPSPGIAFAEEGDELLEARARP
jgi:V8-like Glu-specific endopeptidase